MKLTFAQASAFVAKWKRLGLTDEDLQALETLIMERPQRGAVMQGTGGLRKIRFAPPSWHTGKSGAARVCYVVFADVSYCHLMAVFVKNEQPNLTAAQKAETRKAVAALRDRHKRHDS